MNSPREDGEGEKLYIGEGDPVRPRIETHYAFSSPSTAVAVVPGRSANGRTEWKDGQGRTLKELQEREAREEEEI